jgi:alkaline phosphatase D
MNLEGPRLVVGHVTQNSARVWGRGDAENPVMFVKATAPDGKAIEETVSLSPTDGFTGVAQLESLQPSTHYGLEVSYGASAEARQRTLGREGSLKTFPAPGEAQPCTFLLNSCNFHGWGPFRSNREADLRRAEVAQGVDLVIHAGDQVYADKAPFSFTLDDFRKAYVRTWGQPGTQQVLSSQANYMLADDHEVVNGYAQDGELTGMQRAALWLRGHGGPKEQQYQQLAQNGLRAYDEFQNAHGPQSYGENSRYYHFAHGNHQFFAMDTRFERHNGDGKMVSEGQLDALFQWMSEHRDQPKFIITSSPFVLEKKDSEEKWSSPEFAHQRERIIDFMAENKMEKVVFLCGDIHASAHATMKIEARDGSELNVHELCASPINGTLMRSRSQFLGQSQGTTPGGTDYQVQLHEDSFLGGTTLDTSNSAVMKVHLDGQRLNYEIYRTRQGSEGPARQGGFDL